MINYDVLHITGISALQKCDKQSKSCYQFTYSCNQGARVMSYTILAAAAVTPESHRYWLKRSLSPAPVQAKVFSDYSLPILNCITSSPRP